MVLSDSVDESSWRPIVPVFDFDRQIVDSTGVDDGRRSRINCHRIDLLPVVPSQHEVAIKVGFKIVVGCGMECHWLFAVYVEEFSEDPNFSCRD